MAPPDGPEEPSRLFAPDADPEGTTVLPPNAAAVPQGDGHPIDELTLVATFGAHANTSCARLAARFCLPNAPARGSLELQAREIDRRGSAKSARPHY